MRVLLTRHLVWFDALLLLACPILAYVVRFEGFGLAPADWRALVLYTGLSVVLKLVVYARLGLYRRLWSHTGMRDFEAIMRAAVVSAVLCTGLGLLVLPTTGLAPVRVPISVLFLDACLTAYAVTAPRALARLLAAHGRRPQADRGRRVLIAGAGAAGQLITEELTNNPQLGLVPAAFVDDDRAKQGQRLRDIPILGSLDDIGRVIKEERIDEVVIAMPAVAGAVVRRVVQAAAAAGVPTRTVPGLFDIIAGRVGVSRLRPVRIEDLLRRAPVQTDTGSVRRMIAHQTVLVTGAGGSIGSELCRQLAALEPDELILVGHGENSIFEIQSELCRLYPRCRVRYAIADVRDGGRIGELFARFQPDTVLHAAAHKHVPLMESNVVEAITNNVLGTRNVAWAAAAAGARRLVLISTDKAVRPSSVMGASKRAAELVVQHAAAEYDRAFVAVRFGNVLGSRGSVVPTFLRQIEAGGPVFVTHPEMRRYFMTIPEAVQLALQAGAIGNGGEVFVLDMGEPVRIVDLATDLIRLSGLEPGMDVEVRYSGVRPGEKLYEELFFGEENATPTTHEKVLRARNAAMPPEAPELIEMLIRAASERRPDETLRQMLREIVPDYTPMGDAPEPTRDGATDRGVAIPVVTAADERPLDHHGLGDVARYTWKDARNAAQSPRLPVRDP